MLSLSNILQGEIDMDRILDHSTDYDNEQLEVVLKKIPTWVRRYGISKVSAEIAMVAHDMWLQFRSEHVAQGLNKFDSPPRLFVLAKMWLQWRKTYINKIKLQRKALLLRRLAALHYELWHPLYIEISEFYNELKNLKIEERHVFNLSDYSDRHHQLINKLNLTLGV